MNGTDCTSESALHSRDKKLSYTALKGCSCPLGYLAIPIPRLHRLLTTFGRAILLNSKYNLGVGRQKSFETRKVSLYL